MEDKKRHRLLCFQLKNRKQEKLKNLIPAVTGYVTKLHLSAGVGLLWGEWTQLESLLDIICL